MELEIKKPKFYLIQAGVQDFIANVLNESDTIELDSTNMDGRDITYVKNVKKQFININNIFQEGVAPGQSKPSLQRLKGTVLTLNISNVNSIAVVPKELEDRLSAAVSGLIV